MVREDQIGVLIEQEVLEARIKELGEQISKEYAGKELKLVCILKGGAMFMTQLAKYITIPVTMDFMILSSYGDALISSGTVHIKKDMDDDIVDKHVLIVEDIVDTGNTLQCLLQLLQAREPASLKVCALLDKPARRKVDIKADFSGFDIPDEFVVGYGLDFNSLYRDLPFIGVLKPEYYAK